MNNKIIVSLIALISACSPAQKQAETALTADETTCAAKCAVDQALAPGNQTAAQAVEACALKCGTDILTNQDEQHALMTIFTGTQSAGAAACHPDAGQ